MIIKSVRVRNFRCVRDQTLNCEPLTVLVGPNGSGKSCFLRGLDLFYAADARYGVQDFYADDTSQPIIITVTFSDLTDEERRLFGKYVHGHELIVEKELGWPATREQKFYGIALRHPDFKGIREAEGAREKIRLYNQLTESHKYRDKLQRVRSAAEVDEALEAFELANQEQCEPMREPTQFFGYRQVGGARLERFTLHRLVPAVRDAADDAAEGRGTILTQLMDLVVRSALAQSERVVQLREQTQERYDRIMDPAQLPQLKQLETDLTRHLSTYAPGASVRLDWQKEEGIQIPMPAAEIHLVEDGYPSTVERTGHGLQRAFVLTLLQILAVAERTDEQEAQVGGAEEAVQRLSATPHLILGIEEPELYQHPNRQRHLARVLMQLSTGGIRGVADRVQVLYSTHSPLLLDIERIDSIRRLRKTVVAEDLPKETTLFQATLDEIAGDLETATAAPEGSFRGETLAARLRAVMRPWVYEGFFADLAVLVEGEDDRAAVLGIARAQGHDLESAGISVIPCMGKSNVCTIAAIFKRFRIPVFLIWDSDYDQADAIEENHRLLRLLGHPVEDWPEFIDADCACFKTELEVTVRSELGVTLFEQLLVACRKEFSIAKKQHALKNCVVWRRLIELAHEKGAKSQSLEQIVQKVLVVREKTDER